MFIGFSYLIARYVAYSFKQFDFRNRFKYVCPCAKTNKKQSKIFSFVKESAGYGLITWNL